MSASGLDRLRADFDDGFARPPAPPPAATARLLVVSIAGTSLCLDLSELSGVMLLPRVLRIPGSRPGLMGVAAVRGRVVPVFDLGALLGSADASVTRPGARWMAVVDAEVGFAFTALESHLDAPLTAFRSAPDRHVRRAVSLDAGSRGVVDLRALKRSLSQPDPLPLPHPPSTANDQPTPAAPTAPRGIPP